jgi:hypothetical protein
LLKPGFDGGAILDTFRQMFRTQRFLHVPGLLDALSAELLRVRRGGELQPFYVADRGRYQVSAEHAEEELFAELRGFAEAVVGEPLQPIAHRWLRFAHGDYQLGFGDRVDAAARGRHLELTLDFSAVETGQGETVFTDEQVTFVVPQLPLSLALVERRDSLYRYDRYFNHMIGDAEVWRLRLSLGFTR